MPEGAGNILSDRIGLLPAGQAASRKNTFSEPVREVRVKTEIGKVLRILCNDLDTPAQDIADLYKRRWATERFFRWVKQTLEIRHFLANSEKAVRIQIALAPIAFLLLRLAQNDQKALKSPRAFTRSGRTNLIHRKRIDQLRDHDTPTNYHTPQMNLQ